MPFKEFDKALRLYLKSINEEYWENEMKHEMQCFGFKCNACEDKGGCIMWGSN